MEQFAKIGYPCLTVLMCNARYQLVDLGAQGGCLSEHVDLHHVYCFPVYVSVCMCVCVCVT